MEDFKQVLLLFSVGDLNMDMIDEATVEDIFGDKSEAESPFEENNEENKDDTSADEVNPDSIFDEENPQGSVGNQEDVVEIGEEKPAESNSKDKGSSPKTTFYSSALKALKDDAVLPDLDDEFIANADSPEKFAEAIEKQVEARLDESQKKIKDALEAGVSVSDIKRFENAINYLENIDEDILTSEDDQGESLRRQIIYQDYINKGFKPERAEKEVNKSFNAGTDIDDAKTALDSNKDYFKEEYDNVLSEQKQKLKLERDQKDKQLVEFKKKVLETEDPFGIKVDKQTRQKVLDNLVKPVHKNKSGQLLTQLQKYSEENPMDAEYNFGLFYTLTNGFKDIEKFIGQKVKQQTKSSIRELEHKLKNTPLNSDGTIDFMGNNDQESVFGKNFRLDT